MEEDTRLWNEHSSGTPVGIIYTAKILFPKPDIVANSIILQKPWTYTGALSILMNLPTQSSRERLQTAYALEIDAPNPQEFVFAIRVAQTREKALQQGMTTVPITYLGKPQK